VSAPGAAARLLVTGGAGFIGSCYVRDILARRDGTRITVVDKLTYAGNLANLAPVEADAEQAARFRFVHADIADPVAVGPLVADADAVVNFAAESHVDRSILDPAAFLRTGVEGVHVLLQAVRRETERAADRQRARPPRLLQVSTDEVYGSVEAGFSREGDALAPRSPYAAAKAAGELLARSYQVTYGLDVVITRGSNTYGPYHHPEKLIPLFVTNALDDRPLPLYGDGLQVRDWIHVADHAGAIDHVLRHGTAGDVYNVPGSHPITNRDVVEQLLRSLGKPWSLVRSVEDRPGHDRRYAMDGTKLAALGWTNRVAFPDGLAATIEWFRTNEAWWRAARSGEWDAYYERQYADRLAGSTASAQGVAGAGGPPPDGAGQGPADADLARGGRVAPADVADGGRPAGSGA
jgi:dTDP-glucose 4,6-dehydratase